MEPGSPPPPAARAAPGGATRSPGTGAHGDRGEPRRADGEAAAAVARGTVRIFRSVRGRGPTKAHAFMRDDVVVVVLEETQTRAEQSLIAHGQRAAVLDVRAKLQDAMREELIAMVEGLLDRRVLALLAACHIDPDYSSEVFVLEHAAEGDGPVREHVGEPTAKGPS